MSNQHVYKITAKTIIKKYLSKGGHEYVLYSGEKIIVSNKDYIMDFIKEITQDSFKTYGGIAYSEVHPKQTFPETEEIKDLENKVISLEFEELIGYKTYNMVVNSVETVYSSIEFPVYARNEKEAKEKARELAVSGTLASEWIVDDSDGFAITNIEIQD